MKVAILIPGLPTPTAWMSHVNLVACLAKSGYDVQARANHDPGIHQGRNMLLLNSRPMRVDAVPWGEDYDRMLWVDSDIILEPVDAQKLLEADADIVSGLYPVGPKDLSAAVAGMETDGSNFNQRVHIGAMMGLSDDVAPVLHEVDFVGFGCLMVRKGVFEQMTFPWFDSLYDIMPDGRVLNLGEDFGWCRKAKALGFKIHVHRHVRAKHEKLTVV